MITGSACVCEVFMDVEDRVLIEESIEHIGRLALGRTDGQNAEIAVLIRQMVIEFRSGFIAVMQVDFAALCSSIARTEELAIGR